METTIETRYDHKRGCGWRQQGGTYLISGGLMSSCDKLPVPLTVCPTCHGGIKPSRSWTWVDADHLLQAADCRDDFGCAGCPLARPMGQVGLLFIGEKFYRTPEDFTREALRQGVSRRVPALPNGFVLGQTWVLVAHRKVAFPCPEPMLEHDDCQTCGGTKIIHAPGIFHAFKPTAVEYVVKGDETDEELERKRQRGITPVRVERLETSIPEEVQETLGVEP